MAYNATSDNCYEGTTVLINKYNVRDEKTLQQIERNVTYIRTIELLSLYKPIINDFNSYKQIHYYLFQDIYDWAGQIRNIDISKKGTIFCYKDDISHCANGIFQKLKQNNFLCQMPKNEFVLAASDLYDSLNMLHPFREGNGRTQRVFFTELFNNAGYGIDFDMCDREYLMFATIQSALGVKHFLLDFFKEYTLDEPILKAVPQSTLTQLKEKAKDELAVQNLVKKGENIVNKPNIL